MAAYNLISTTTVGSGGAASIEFGSIPQIYTDLVLVCSLQHNGALGAADRSYFVYANNSTTSYTYRRLTGYNGSAASDNGSSAIVGAVGGTTNSSVFNNAQIYIPNYASSNNKVFSCDNVSEANSSTNYELDMSAILWSNTAAITSLKLVINSQNIVQHSSASLYGIKSS